MLEDIKTCCRHIIHYNMWYGSLFLHALIIGTLFYIGPFQVYQATAKAQKKQAHAFEQKAVGGEMKKRLDDMKQTKKIAQDLFNHLNKQYSINNNHTSNPEPSGEVVSDTEKATTPQDYLQQGKDIADEVTQMAFQLKVNELASMLEISEQAARKELVSKNPDQASLAQLNNGDTSDMLHSIIEMQTALKASHIQAQKSLADIVNNQQQKDNGLSVSLTADPYDKDSQDSEKTSTTANSDFFEKAIQHIKTSNMQFAMSGSEYAIPLSQYDHTLQPRSTKPNDIHKNIQHFSTGRIVGKEGIYAEQIFIDAWHFIGPFPFFGKEKRNEPYPPENIIDFGAFYPGKHGYVGWQYATKKPYPIQPPEAEPQAVYYGYSEIKFEQETTAWVGLGCDDDCKLWLNDQLVWSSGNQYKEWFAVGDFRDLTTSMIQRDLSERYLKLKFHAGINRLLFRLDNGPTQIFFSMTINRIFNR